MDIRTKAGLAFIAIFIAGCSTLPVTEPVVETPTDTEISQGAAIPQVTELPKRAEKCDIEEVLPPIVASMVAQKIPYSQNPSNEWRDCSGNFLRLSSYLAERCPGVEQVAPKGVTNYTRGGDNKAPDGAHARTTRGIAKWYDDKGLFIPIFYDGTDSNHLAPKALLDNRNKIRPGTVLWFAKEKPREADGKKLLFNLKDPRGFISHMATVVSVTKEGGKATRKK